MHMIQELLRKYKKWKMIFLVETTLKPMMRTKTYINMYVLNEGVITIMMMKKAVMITIN